MRCLPSGLIHDLGRVLMFLHFRHEMTEILTFQKQEGLPLYIAEQRYGLFHGDVGEYIAVMWGFSDMLATIAGCHHDPQKAGPHVVGASVIFLADGIVKKMGLFWTAIDADEQLLLPKCLGLHVADVKSVAAQLKEEKSHIVENWGSCCRIGLVRILRFFMHQETLFFE